ncbi:unnamed protein product [Anisakis simplex]|uniref:BURP domain-containing protein n=1 Tax=Anisakis simplex TaxID=6269 RepID=A0A0M3JZ37_ANISI|nr:unnamed protein product [Anisakis simplex]
MNFHFQATSSANVIQLGREDASTERGFDYAVAIVSKRTGKVQYVPAKLVNFQATYASDPAPLFGHKPSQRIDYTVDNSGQSETFADERRALTTEFGSHRKIKVQEDFERRRVSEVSILLGFYLPQTLKIMMESTFSSPVAVKKEEQDDDVKTNPLSISCDNQSEVLPKANQNANLPAEVYSTDAFLTEDEISSIGNDAVAYLKRSKEELIASDDCSELLYGIVSNAVTDCRKASLALLLIAMVKSFKVCFLMMIHLNRNVDFARIQILFGLNPHVNDGIELFFFCGFKMLSGRGKCFLVKQDWVKITSLPASVLGKIRVDFLRAFFLIVLLDPSSFKD